MELKTKQGVVITDIEIPFFSMVALLVQIAIAAIPAMLIVALIVFGFTMIFSMAVPKPEPAKPAPAAQTAPAETPAIPIPDTPRIKGTKRAPWMPPE